MTATRTPLPLVSCQSSSSRTRWSGQGRALDLLLHREGALAAAVDAAAACGACGRRTRRRRARPARRRRAPSAAVSRAACPLRELRHRSRSPHEPCGWRALLVSSRGPLDRNSDQAIGHERRGDLLVAEPDLRLAGLGAAVLLPSAGRPCRCRSCSASLSPLAWTAYRSPVSVTRKSEPSGLVCLPWTWRVEQAGAGGDVGAGAAGGDLGGVAGAGPGAQRRTALAVDLAQHAADGVAVAAAAARVDLVGLLRGPAVLGAEEGALRARTTPRRPRAASPRMLSRSVCGRVDQQPGGEVGDRLRPCRAARRSAAARSRSGPSGPCRPCPARRQPAADAGVGADLAGDRGEVDRASPVVQGRQPVVGDRLRLLAADEGAGQRTAASVCAAAHQVLGAARVDQVALPVLALDVQRLAAAEALLALGALLIAVGEDEGAFCTVLPLPPPGCSQTAQRLALPRPRRRAAGRVRTGCRGSGRAGACPRPGSSSLDLDHLELLGGRAAVGRRRGSARGAAGSSCPCPCRSSGPRSGWWSPCRRSPWCRARPSPWGPGLEHAPGAEARQDQRADDQAGDDGAQRARRALLRTRRRRVGGMPPPCASSQRCTR